MKKLTHWITAAVLIGSVLAFAARAADSPSVLLQKGIYAEETEGNVDAAIKIYEQIGAEAATNRAVAAQAHYRLAVCHQKKGSNPQAIALLKELLRQFPTETALGEQAQARLTELGQPPTDVVTMRKIPVGSTGHVMAVSPNGRFVAAWNGSLDIMVTDTSTAKSWNVVKGADGGKVYSRMAFSPDSQRIAYDRLGSMIVISKSDASESRRVFDVRPDLTEGQLEVLGWTPDASRLIVFRRFGRRSTVLPILGTVDVQSGTWSEIQTLPKRDNRMGVALSPDGRYLAAVEAMDDQPGKIILYDLQTKDETTLVDREVQWMAGWSPWWGEKLLFVSERTGTAGLWAITVKEGRAIGGPVLVNAGLGQRSIRGIASDGTIFYTENKGSSDVYVMSANFETGEVTREPRRVSDRSPGFQDLPLWSHDGQSLMMSATTAKKGFMVVSMASGEHQEHSPAGLTILRTTWAQAGGFLLFQASGRGWRHGVHRYDLATGKTEMVVETFDFGPMSLQPELSHDGTSFYLVRLWWEKNPRSENKERRTAIIRRDLRSGKEEVVYGPGQNVSIWDQLKLSPDGRRLAFLTYEVKKIDGKSGVEVVATAINVVPLDGGGPQVVAQLGPGEKRSGVAWTPDGKRIVYVRDGKIWSTALGTGETVSLNTSKVALGNLAIHPDGRQIAFAGKPDGPSGLEVWAMEGALTRQTAASVRAP